MTENEVIKHVVQRLLNEDCVNIEPVAAGMRGIDVRARDKAGREVYVEAKGDTSSNSRSTNFGKPFTAGQAYNSAGAAVLSCLKYAAEDQSRRVILAAPGSRHFKAHLDPIEQTLRRAGVEVWLFSPSA